MRGSAFGVDVSPMALGVIKREFKSKARQNLSRNICAASIGTIKRNPWLGLAPKVRQKLLNKEVGPRLCRYILQVARYFLHPVFHLPRQRF